MPLLDFICKESLELAAEVLARGDGDSACTDEGDVADYEGVPVQYNAPESDKEKSGEATTEARRHGGLHGEKQTN